MGPRTPPIRLGRIQPREEQRRLGKGDFVIRQGADGIQGGADSVRFPVASGLLRPCRVSIVGRIGLLEKASTIPVSFRAAAGQP